MGNCFSKSPPETSPNPQQPSTKLPRKSSARLSRKNSANPSSSRPPPPTTWSKVANVLPSCAPVRHLGEGTFGTVVLVRERATGELFAAKVMSKSHLIAAQSLDSVVMERRVLREAGPHPFVVECHSGFQTNDAVVLVLEYVSGGDMYDLMKKHGCLTEAQARFYLAEIIVALKELHRHDFVFRDLKLENILIDEKGHVRLTDFGLAGKFISGEPGEQAIFDISGTAIYQAPEMLMGKGHGRVVDWWALGVLAYVLMAGRPPFAADESREMLHHRIQNKKLDLEDDDRLSHISPQCRDLIYRLLDKNPATRLGSDGNDALDVQNHPFFDGIDWKGVVNFELEPPLCPGLEPRPSDSGGCDPQLVRHAESKLADKVHSKHKGIQRGFKRSASARRRDLDAGEYKPVVVNGGSSKARVSIGLDFQGVNATAGGKTFTGTADDFGRFIEKR